MTSMLAIVVATAVSAQGPTGLSGHIRNAADSTPVRDAWVEVVNGPRTTSDSAGAFQFRSMKNGRYELRVRRLGFRSFARYVEVKADKPAFIVVDLVPLPQHLTVIEIEGRRVTVPYRMEDVYRRAASGFGHLITPEEIERRKPFYVRELLNGLPGISVDNYKVRFRRCGDPVGNDSSVNLEATKVQVYIDGRRVTRFDRGGTNVDMALDMVPVSSIVAIEVYVGVAQIPAEFSVDACAAIAIWTKRY